MVSLSDEEQKILKDMEKRLFEHDRSFVNKVSSGFDKPRITPSLLWPVIMFLLGFAGVIVNFRSSLLMATVEFLTMFLSAFIFERHYRAAKSGMPSITNTENTSRHKPISNEISVIAHKVTHLWRKGS